MSPAAAVLLAGAVLVLALIVIGWIARPPVRVPPARPRRDVREAIDATGAEVERTVYAAGGSWRGEEPRR